MKNKIFLALILLSPLSYSKGINVSKEQFEKSFCKYINSPDVITESTLCPLKFTSDNESGNEAIQKKYTYTFINGSILDISVDKKTKKIASVIYTHSNDLSPTNDVMQTRFAILHSIDIKIPHNEEYYHFISAGKAVKKGINTPAENNNLTHNHINYTYTYDKYDDNLIFRADNDF